MDIHTIIRNVTSWEKNNTEVLNKEKETELEKDKGEYLRLKKKLEEAGVKL